MKFKQYPLMKVLSNQEIILAFSGLMEQVHSLCTGLVLIPTIVWWLFGLKMDFMSFKVALLLSQEVHLVLGLSTTVERWLRGILWERKSLLSLMRLQLASFSTRWRVQSMDITTLCMDGLTLLRTTGLQFYPSILFLLLCHSLSAKTRLSWTTYLLKL